jgi:hypothetical protein
MLALGGAFWIGLGVGMLGQQGHWVVSAVGTVVQVGGAVWLIRAAMRLRRRSGFQRAELRRLEGALLGLSMATVMWASAAYVLLHADRIADRACAENWAV